MGIRERILEKRRIADIIASTNDVNSPDYGILDIRDDNETIQNQPAMVDQPIEKISLPTNSRGIVETNQELPKPISQTNFHRNTNFANFGDKLNQQDFGLVPDPLGKKFGGEKISLPPLPSNYSDKKDIAPTPAPATTPAPEQVKKPSVGEIAAAKMDIAREPDPQVKAEKTARFQNLLRGLLIGGATVSSKLSNNPKAKTGSDIIDTFRASDELTLLRDPNSRPSKVLQGKFYRMNPSLQNHPTMGNLSGSEILKLGLDKPIASAEDENDLAMKKYLLQLRGEDRRQREQLDNNTREFAKDTGKIYKVANQITDIEQKLGFSLDDAIKNGLAVPGTKIQGIPVRFKLDEKDRELEGALQRLFNTILYNQSGTAVTSNEMERLKSSMNQGFFTTNRDLLKALYDYKQAVKKEYAQTAAGHSDATKKAYADRGGEILGQPTGGQGSRPMPAKTIPKEEYIIKQAKDGKKYKFDPVTKENLGEYNG